MGDWGNETRLPITHPPSPRTIDFEAHIVKRANARYNAYEAGSGGSGCVKGTGIDAAPKSARFGIGRAHRTHRGWTADRLRFCSVNRLGRLSRRGLRLRRGPNLRSATQPQLRVRLAGHRPGRLRHVGVGMDL